MALVHDALEVVLGLKVGMFVKKLGTSPLTACSRSIAEDFCERVRER